VAAVASAAEIGGGHIDRIKIGQTMPYSGPVSRSARSARARSAIFKMVNDRGGINGRKVNLISLDDANARRRPWSSPALVASDEVALIFSLDRQPPKHRNRQIPAAQEHPATVHRLPPSKFADLTQYPQATWACRGRPYEARLYARYALAKNPNANSGDFAERRFAAHYLLGPKDVLGEKYDSIVTAATYEIQDPTIDSRSSAESIRRQTCW